MNKLRKILFLILALAISTSARAQQQPDPVVLQRAVAALQAQRNQALDSAAAAEVRAAGLADDLAKAQARIKELEPKPEAPAKKN